MILSVASKEGCDPPCQGSVQCSIPAPSRTSNACTAISFARVSSCVAAWVIVLTPVCLPPIALSGADVSGLLQLPDSCTSLLLGGSAFGDAAASVLAQLRQLEYLCVHNASGFSDAGLLQLAETDMDLWQLYVHDAGLSDAISKEGEVQLEWSPEVRFQILLLYNLLSSDIVRNI